jgi:hypothetical protein
LWFNFIWHEKYHKFFLFGFIFQRLLLVDVIILKG